MKILLTSVFKVCFLAMYLYTIKCNLGINLIEDCHAWEVMTGRCSSLHFSIIFSDLK